ncbi:MAG TPA: ketol-acid reductoisomerase [Candidatus Bathyarchaeia archaeon]|nr:ketol-acid reductoisomerase [Candidatus Bathyarchaeia archaeon]
MVKVYYDKDIDDSLIHKTTVAVIGYGIQGRAQALNLRDSGVEVLVGLREDGNSWKLAKSDGFQPVTVSHASSKASLIMMLIPDPKQPEVFKSEIQPNLKPGKALSFAHGYNIHFKDIVPSKDVDVIMVAPKSPGQNLRDLYVNGFGVPALFAVKRDSTGHARELVLALCKALGCSRAGVIETTFKDETESDLFGEQAVLVGGLIRLIVEGYETLVEAGYPPELSYYETCNEMKLIMDLVYQYGFAGMLRRVSDTAKFGGLTVGPKVIDQNVRKNMKKILKDIQSGKFAKSWTGDREKTAKQLNVMIKKFEKHPMEKVGKNIRKLSGLEK